MGIECIENEWVCDVDLTEIYVHVIPEHACL